MPHQFLYFIHGSELSVFLAQFSLGEPIFETVVTSLPCICKPIGFFAAFHRVCRVGDSLFPHSNYQSLDKETSADWGMEITLPNERSYLVEDVATSSPDCCSAECRVL